MELVWLEDFLELCATRNFSSAANARNITQPAFSRRVRALEQWVGAELFDRSVYPICLTKAGELFLESSRTMTRDIYQLRDECRQLTASGQYTIHISALHSIAMGIFPMLAAHWHRDFNRLSIQMAPSNFYECVEALALGKSDMMFAYSSPVSLPLIQTGQFVSHTLMTDSLVLVSQALPNGQPLHSLDTNQSVPLVSYTSDCFLGKMQASLLELTDAKKICFHKVYENPMSECNKRMIMVGYGCGWLPHSIAREKLEEGKLVVIGGSDISYDLTVLAYRRPGHGSSILEQLWHNRDLTAS